MAHASATPAAIVLADVRTIFGARLHAFVTYAPDVTPGPSLALVTSLEFADLTACAERASRWLAAGAAVPVLLTRDEFTRSLDAFPVEFGEILTRHTTLHGDDPFAGLSVATADLRRACETRVRSLLLHVREDYIEAAGRERAVAAVVTDSAPEFRALLGLIARLDGADASGHGLATWAETRLGLDAKTVSNAIHLAQDPHTSHVDAARMFPAYLTATEHLARHLDAWPVL